MFEVKVRTHFSAAHKILEHPGKCQRLHGHNWNVDVTLKSPELDRIGMAVDFSHVKDALKEVLTPLDHTYLNELPYFSTLETNPTAERICKFIFESMASRIRNLAPHCEVSRVDVYETDTCSASYYLS